MCYAGTEISNAARSYAYGLNGLKPHTMTLYGCGCDDLAEMLGELPYRRPDLDDPAPPWVDPLDLDSYEFGGFVITRLDGIDAAPVDRPLTNRLGDGAVPGRKRYGPRIITVTGVLIGSSCCGISYGHRWLSAVLAGSQGCGESGCGGDDLRFLDCCPEICEDAADFTSYPACANDHWRTLRDVVLTSEVQVISEIGGACPCCQGCPAREVTFQLTAGRAHAFREPVDVAECVTFPEPVDDGVCELWSTDPDCMSDEQICAAQEPVPCPLDPACPVPTVPELPLPTDRCQCDPIAGRVRTCLTVPAGAAPSWFDAVPIITLSAGVLPLRAVRIRFYSNPLGLDLDQLDPCGFCAELNISYLPASATMVLDGTVQQGIVQCPGRAETSASTVLAGPAGSPLTWPVIECGSPYLVCVEADAASIAPTSCVSLSTVVREV
jgi:hypothetical protein